MECIDFEGSPAVARDHAAHPRNHGPLKDFDGHARITGPCGRHHGVLVDCVKWA
jgi:hypothetical protein